MSEKLMVLPSPYPKLRLGPVCTMSILEFASSLALGSHGVGQDAGLVDVRCDAVMV